MKNKLRLDANLNAGFEASVRGLREFGYHDVTSEMIREIHAAWIAGKEPPHGVIGQFAVRNFDDYPDIFGVPARGGV